MNNRRIRREAKTIAAMVHIYCHDNHKTNRGQLCDDCRDLLQYATQRLEQCPYQEDKTTCARCPVHCYKPVMRDKIRAVMRYAGPRMSYRHPVLTLFHYFDGFRKALPGK